MSWRGPPVPDHDAYMLLPLPGTRWIHRAIGRLRARFRWRWMYRVWYGVGVQHWLCKRRRGTYDEACTVWGWPVLIPGVGEGANDA